MNKLLGLAQPQGYYTLADRIAESSIKKSSRTLIQQALKSAVLVRTGYLTPSPTVLMMDMEKGQPIANFRESRLKRLLILQSLHATPQTERILANVGEAVCHQKHFLRQLDVAQVKQLYQNH